jgi:protein NirF
MIRTTLVSLLFVLLTPALTLAAETRGTGDLALVIERASGSIQIIETTGNSSLVRIEGLGEL